MPEQTRREFIVKSGAVAAAVAGLGADQPKSASEPVPASTQGRRLGVAIIGTGGRGIDHVREIPKIDNARIVALCDADSAILKSAVNTLGKGDYYCGVDFRDVLKLKEVEAVVIATPDHNHVALCAAAMRAGKHVYCEKPLGHTVSELRALVKIADQTKVITQTGIQIHARDNYRRVVELIQDGAIGKVSEVHIWNERFQRGYNTEPADPPATLNYDLWSWPLKVRPFQRSFHPYSWREWKHFANGLLGDVGSHFFDVAFWALDLKYPTKITADGGARAIDLCAVWNRVTYEFPALKLEWYDPPTKPAALQSWKLQDKWQSEGIMFIGDKGMLYTNYGQHALLPEEKFKQFKPPTSRLASSPGHQAEWINACLKGDQKLATTPFSYGALLAETALLGAVAFYANKPLTYDAANMKFPGNPEAEKFLQSQYREGFSL